MYSSNSVTDVFVQTAQKAVILLSLLANAAAFLNAK